MRWLDRLEEWIVMLMLAAMTGLTFVQVVLRYVFNSGFTWALELTTVFFAVMIFVGVSYGVRVGAHIGNGDPVTLARQTLGEMAADALTGAGNHDGLSVFHRHGIPRRLVRSEMAGRSRSPGRRS